MSWDFWKDFAFAQPWWLLGLIALPFIAWLQGGRRPAPAIRFSGLAPLRAVGTRKPAGWGGFGRPLLFLGLALLIVALARPRLGKTQETIESSGLDIILVLDVSGSMRERDFTLDGDPASRIDAVKIVARRFIEARPNDRIGAVIFAQVAVVLCPATLDHPWLLQNLERIQAEMFGRGGTFIAAAIASASNRLVENKTAKSKIVILLTDGAQTVGEEDPVEAARAAGKLGVKIYSIGAGSDPEPGDRRRPGFAEADLESLKKVASVAGGMFFRATDTNSLESIFKQIDKMEKTEVKLKRKTEWNELFQWFAAGGRRAAGSAHDAFPHHLEDGAMTFADPHVLWALAALPIFAVFYIVAERARRRAINFFLAARLQPILAGSVSIARRRTAFVLLLAGLALCIMALARPRWGVSFEEQTAVGRDVIIAMDTSRSMLAQDLSPNRLDRAKLAALDLLRDLEGDRVGLVAFAGDAFLQVPLTPDMEALEKSIRNLDTEAISQGGSNLALAIETAAEAFGKGESNQRALIFFSDGEELQEDALEAASNYKDKFRIYTVGVGTEAGGPIVRQTRNGTEYMKDQAGNVVTTKLDETRLREVAKRAGGFYLRLQNGPADMRDLAQRGLGTMSEKESGTLKREIPNEWYQWPLVGGIVLLIVSILLGEHRRVGRTAVAALMLCLPHSAEAGWLSRAVSRIFKESNEEAPAGQVETLTDKVSRLEASRDKRPGVPELEYNVGCAAYSAGDYEKAATSFSTALGSGVPEIQAKAAYNLGNSLARRGAKAEKEGKVADWNSAIQQYDHALKLQPGNEEAKVNREIVQKALKALEEQEKKQQQQQQQDQKQEGDKKEQKNDKSQQKDQKGQQENQKGDQQQKGDEKKDGQDQQSQQEAKNKEKGKDGKEKDDNKVGEQKSAEQDHDGDKQGKPQEANEKGDPKEAQKVEQKEKPNEQPKDGKLQQAGEQDKEQDKDAKEADEAAQAAREGRMTDKDAQILLQSMRRHERVVRPQQLIPQQRRTNNNGKDW